MVGTTIDVAILEMGLKMQNYKKQKLKSKKRAGVVTT